MISACTTRSSLRRIKKEKIDHETEIFFFIFVNIWTCYCWFIIFNVTLWYHLILWKCSRRSLLQKHFHNTGANRPTDMIEALSSEIVQTDTKPHQTLDFLRFWGILTRHLQIQGGRGALTRKFKCKSWSTRQAMDAKSAEGSFSSYSSADTEDVDCHPSLKI